MTKISNNMQIPCKILNRSLIQFLRPICVWSIRLFVGHLYKSIWKRVTKQHQPAVLPLLNIMQDLPLRILKLCLWGSLIIFERIPRKRQAPTFFEFFFLASLAPFFRSKMLSSRLFPSSSSGKRSKTTKVEEWFLHKTLLHNLSVFTRVLMKLLVDSRGTVSIFWLLKTFNPFLIKVIFIYILEENVF